MTTTAQPPQTKSDTLKSKFIEDILSSQGLLTAEQLQFVKSESKRRQESSEKVITQMNWVTPEQLIEAKAGVIGLTKTVALEFSKQNIRVNAVCPGVIQTQMIDRLTGKNKEAEKQFENMEPIGRMGKPEEVAEVVVFLCSDSASFVTGNAMAVDGGWIAQ